MRDITLETDDIGIWLIEMTPDGMNQIGHVSWYEITKRLEKQLLQQKFMLALTRIDEEDDLI